MRPDPALFFYHWVSFLNPNGQTHSSHSSRTSTSGDYILPVAQARNLEVKPSLTSRAIHQQILSTLLSNINPEFNHADCHHPGQTPILSCLDYILASPVITLLRPWLHCTLFSPPQRPEGSSKTSTRGDGHGGTF